MEVTQTKVFLPCFEKKKNQMSLIKEIDSTWIDTIIQSIEKEDHMMYGIKASRQY